MRKAIKKVIAAPQGVEFKLELPRLTVSGPLGSATREFRLDRVNLKLQDSAIVLECGAATKKEKKLLNTIAAHITNMAEGVVKGFEYRLQVCSVHFPMTIKHDKEHNRLIIRNFLGETKDREARLLPGIELAIEGDIIKLRGIDLERVAQCAANIEAATRIKARDRRVYQDGIFIISKAGEAV